MDATDLQVWLFSSTCSCQSSWHRQDPWHCSQPCVVAAESEREETQHHSHSHWAESSWCWNKECLNSTSHRSQICDANCRSRWWVNLWTFSRSPCTCVVSVKQCVCHHLQQWLKWVENRTGLLRIRNVSRHRGNESTTQQTEKCNKLCHVAAGDSRGGDWWWQPWWLHGEGAPGGDGCCKPLQPFLLWQRHASQPADERAAEMLFTTRTPAAQALLHSQQL